jgi:Zn-dependent protease with chaperone function
VRPLRPWALPTDTSLRFLLVLGSVTAASLYLFGSLWFLFRGELFAASVVRCAAVPGTLADQIGTAAEQLAAEHQCRLRVSREQGLVQLAGSVVVLLAAYVGYRLWPRVLERRAHLTPADPHEAQALLREVGALSAEAGVDPPPRVRLDATNTAMTGFAYGSGRPPRLGLTGGLVVSQVLDPGVFRAVVRHELGHVADRDVPWTYYAAALWWSFLGLAVVPAVVLFATRDLGYLLRLGWRTVALAALVALTVTALLRVREAYADARAAQWGSGPDLDRVLAGAPESASHRPAALRTHPTNSSRRTILADPDRLFTASGWAALAAGIAASTAQISLGDLAYLLTPRWHSVLAGLVVAPVLAALICTYAWRVGLREAVRGRQAPVAARLGLGLGVGMAIGPLLSLDAAVGNFAEGPAGWAGYLLWAAAQVIVAAVLVRWTLDTARLRVAAALGQPGGPRSALAGHILVTAGLFGLWLVIADQTLTILTSSPASLLALAPVLHLWPESALGANTGPWPLALLLGLLVAPLRALQLWGRPWAGWFWRADQAATEDYRPQSANARAGVLVGVLGPCGLVGTAAGVVGGAAAPVGLLLGGALAPSVQASDAFLVEVSWASGLGLMAGSVAAGVLAALVLPRGWWPMGLLASVVAVLVGGAVVYATWSAYRFGLVGLGGTANRPLGWAGLGSEILAPGLRALLPTVLAVGVAGLLRPGLFPDGSVAPPPRANGGTTPLRAGLAAIGAMTVAAMLAAGPTLGVLRVTVPEVEGPGYSVSVPVGWQTVQVEASGVTMFQTIAQDVQVVVVPAQVTGLGRSESARIGGREAALLNVTDSGLIRTWIFEVGNQGQAGYWVTVAATERARAERAVELQDLFDAIRWADDG